MTNCSHCRAEMNDNACVCIKCGVPKVSAAGDKSQTAITFISRFLKDVLAYVVTCTGDDKNLLVQAVQNCRHAMDAQQATIWLREREGNRLVLKAAAGYTIDLCNPQQVMAIAPHIMDGILYYDLEDSPGARQGITSYIYKTQKHQEAGTHEELKTKCGDYNKTQPKGGGCYDTVLYGKILDECERRDPPDHPCHQLFGVPITFDKGGKAEKQFGVMKVENKKDDTAFTVPEQEAMKTLADLLAFALNQLERRHDRGDSFMHQVVLRTKELSEIVKQVVTQKKTEEVGPDILQAIQRKADVICTLAQTHTSSSELDPAVSETDVVRTLTAEMEDLEAVYGIKCRIKKYGECEGLFRIRQDDCANLVQSLMSITQRSEFTVVSPPLQKSVDIIVSGGNGLNIDFIINGAMDYARSPYASSVEAVVKRLGGSIAPSPANDGVRIILPIEKINKDASK